MVAIESRPIWKTQLNRLRRPAFIVLGVLCMAVLLVSVSGLIVASGRNARATARLFFGTGLLSFWGMYWAFNQATESASRDDRNRLTGDQLLRRLLWHGEVYPVSEDDIEDVATRLDVPMHELASGLTALSPMLARKLVESSGCSPLDLRSLTSLTHETAAELSRRNGVVMLNGVQDLTPEVARELAKLAAPLHLNGVRSLSEATATALARHPGWLFLDGLKSLPSAVAGPLAQHGWIVHLGDHYNLLSLDGVEDLSREAAAALAEFQGDLSLNGIVRTSPEVLRSLAGGKCTSLSLVRLEAMSDDVAEMCGAGTLPLFLSSALRVSVKGFAVLSGNPNVSLTDTTSMSDA